MEKPMEYVEASRRVIAQNGFALSMTAGVSMRPLIWGGRHCVAVEAVEDEPSIGDIMMFRQRLADGTERSVVHRLVAVRGEGGARRYIMRGDNCYGTETVRREEIIGRVTEVHRMGAWRPWYALPGRRFAVTDAAYRRYVRVWTALWPVRRWYYKLRWAAGTLKRGKAPTKTAPRG